MQIISSAGEMRAMLPEVGVINSRGIVPHARMVVKVTSSVAVTRAATTGWVSWDTAVYDSYGCFNPAVSATRIYIPMPGWYLASAYLKTVTGTAHDATMQIHNSYLASHIGYKKWNLPAASANYPNLLALNAVCYLPQLGSAATQTSGFYFYVNWGTSQSITSLTGEANIGFSIWKLS
jgi:hypothetical protein